MIQFENVSFAYAGNIGESISNVNLGITTGECVLLCGRSGCGKTTMMRMVNGLIPSFFPGTMSGRVLVKGNDVASTPMYTLANQVGSVFQNPRTQFFNTDTDSEISFGIENEGLPQAELFTRVRQAKKILKIEHLSDRTIFQLSGGEKQKVAFASVYAMYPDIFLLDEPSSNLDGMAIDNLRDTLTLLKRQGKTILISEHRLYYLMDVIDRALYFENGQLAESFTPEQLKALSPKRRSEMGLRATNLMNVIPESSSIPKSDNTLAFENVQLRYGNKVILDSLSLSAKGGEVIGVIGQNGAGKTTFSRAVCGLHKEAGGRITHNGLPQTAAERRKASYMVMQDVNYQLFAESVEKECVLGIRNPDMASVEATLKELELTQVCNRHPNTLSGGQKQRLAVAVGMICRKKILVFDEPTSGLDYDSMVRVASLINRLAQKGHIIFVTTHDYEFICKTCTKLFLLGEGKKKDELSVCHETIERMPELLGIGELRTTCTSST